MADFQTPKMALWALIVALNAGVFAQTKTFHREFAGPPRWRPRLIFLAWGFHGISLVVALAKLWVYTQPAECKGCAPISAFFFPIAQCWVWSLISYATLFLGLVTLFLYAYRNTPT
jgi:hypothetical protein